MILKIFSFCFLFIFYNCYSQPQHQQPDMGEKTSISVRLKPNTQYRLSYLSKIPPAYILFKNDFPFDTTITLRLNLSHPTEFMRLMTPDSYDMLLVFPGDSVVFDEQKNIAFSTSFKKYVNDYIYIPSYSGILSNPSLINNPFKNGFKHLLSVSEDIYQNNNTKIQSLDIEDDLKKYLSVIILYEKYYQIFALTDLNLLSPTELKTLDSIGTDAISKHNLFQVVSPKLNSLMRRFVEVSAKANGATSKNYWNYFTKANAALKTHPYYSQFAYNILSSIFFYHFDKKKSSGDKEFSSLQDAHETLKNNKDTSSLKDSLIRLANILLGTKTNLAKAKTELNNFENGKFIYLFKNEAMANHEPKNTRLLSKEKLVNIHNEEFRLNDILMDTKYKLIVVDFWASWCAPCIEQFTALKKMENEMRNLPIKFIGVSTDELNNVDSWIERAKLYFPNSLDRQFRLKNDSTSEFKNLLQVNTIPRYIVLDNKGNVIDNDLERPSEREFKAKLQQYLKRLQ